MRKKKRKKRKTEIGEQNQDRDQRQPWRQNSRRRTRQLLDVQHLFVHTQGSELIVSRSTCGRDNDRAGKDVISESGGNWR